MSDGRRILLIDVMGTLVHDPWPETFTTFFDMPLEELLAAKDPHAWVDFEHGWIDEPQFLERFFRDRRPVDRERLKDAAFSAYRLLPGIAALLGELAASGVAIHALSNYPIWYHAIEERTALSRHLSWSFVSCDTGLRKPDPRSFRHPPVILGVEAAECLFVDDRESNVRAARATGLDGVRFLDATSLRAELVAREVLAP